ncbi:MAG: TauD/TfdA family dioxygenase [Actinobacteria bacterium]|nr:TauD/TfdA family dioxygenase [Actinomycetota bacterium]
MTLETVPLSAALGVEVRGVDLHADPEPWSETLRDLLTRHHLLCFRVTDLAPAEQQRLLAGFGPLLDESFDGSGYSLVSNVEAGGVLGEWEYLFHSDLEFTDDPIRVISLYALELPDAPTSTRFANTARAARRLDAATRDRVEGRTAVHVYPLTSARGDVRFRLADVDAGAATAEHPVLMAHPVTGEDLLYVGAMQTDSIVGLPDDESEELLARCWDVLYAPDNVYEHVWSAGDLLVWDNLALHHARSAVSGRRTLRRVPVGSTVARLRTT